MNILIVRTDKLGDFITALPTCKILKQYNPKFKITVCISSLNEELANRCDFIDDVIVDDTKNALELAKKLKPYNFDISFTLFSDTKVALAQFLARISLRVAPATKVAQIFYNKRVKQRRSRVKMAEYEYNIALVKSYFTDINSSYPQPLLGFDSKKEDIIAFHVGFGGSSDANLTIKEYFELAQIVKNESRYTPVMTFGPTDNTFLQEAKKLNTEIEFYISKDGLVAFGKFLSTLKLFVSTSTGTYHLAALVGTETMTFFADSLFASVKRWKAVSDESIQHPFMLSQDIKKRQDTLLHVKQKLREIIA